MHYISTRGQAPALDFAGVVLAGLASDGGLYVPNSWPQLSAADMRDMVALDYPCLAATLMAPYAAGTLTYEELYRLAVRAYAPFRHAAIAPLVQLGRDHWLLELFHGPTLAFKDYALQFLGYLFDHLLAARGEVVTVIGATSGDTGSAAIEACRDKPTMRVFILHPHGRVSGVQRRQMTTVLSDNVYNIALQGTFDDCQDMVKALFADTELRTRLHLTAVNSINWARILAQVVYYFWAALRLGAPDRPISFAVPTGNFGNVYAAWVARQMGLPIERLVIGTNRNDILTRFFATGQMTKGAVEPSLSPSMDIQVSSNFERLLFDLWGRDGARVQAAMQDFRTHGGFAVTGEELTSLTSLFQACQLSDAATLQTIEKNHKTTGVTLDPHSAIGVGCGAQFLGNVPMISLACAHPAKFPEAVHKATGMTPALPTFLGGLMHQEERVQLLPNDYQRVRAFILGQGAFGK
jgi:threonine synthase